MLDSSANGQAARAIPLSSASATNAHSSVRIMLAPVRWCGCILVVHQPASRCTTPCQHALPNTPPPMQENFESRKRKPEPIIAFLSATRCRRTVHSCCMQRRVSLVDAERHSFKAGRGPLDLVLRYSKRRRAARARQCTSGVFDSVAHGVGQRGPRGRYSTSVRVGSACCRHCAPRRQHCSATGGKAESSS